MTDAEAREMARELVRGSIAEDAVSQFIAQIIKHTYDERVRPLRRQVANLESKLAKAEAGLLAIAKRDEQMIWGEDYEVEEAFKDMRDIALATLAEIKGEKP